MNKNWFTFMFVSNCRVDHITTFYKVFLEHMLAIAQTLDMCVDYISLKLIVSFLQFGLLSLQSLRLCVEHVYNKLYDCSCQAVNFFNHVNCAISYFCHVLIMFFSCTFCFSCLCCK